MKSLLTLISRTAASAALLFACWMPAQDAQALTAFEALDKVCAEFPDGCGPYSQYKPVADACFVSYDDFKCAVAIINSQTGNAVGNAKKQVDAIVSCVSKGLPIGPVCDQYLQAAGLSAAEINEAYVVIKKCAAISDVDDAIVCADMLIDSQAFQETGLEVPSWVNSLFDIYMAIRDKDYWGLVYYVGATVACAVGEYFTGVDVCNLLKSLAEIGSSVVDAAGAIVDFLTDLFGSSGGTTYKIGGKEVGAFEFAVAQFNQPPAPGIPALLAARLNPQSDYNGKFKADVIGKIKNGPFRTTFATGWDDSFEKGWVVFNQKDVYPLWDKEIRDKAIPARAQQISTAINALPGEFGSQVLSSATRNKALADAVAKCMVASSLPTSQIKQWTDEGRPGAGEAIGDVVATCGFRVAKLALTNVSSCSFSENNAKESIAATCTTNASHGHCTGIAAQLGAARVSECKLDLTKVAGIRIMLTDGALEKLGSLEMGGRCGQANSGIDSACKDAMNSIAKDAARELGSLRFVAGTSKPPGYGDNSKDFDAIYRHEPHIKARQDWSDMPKYEAALAAARARVTAYNDRLSKVNASYNDLQGKHGKLSESWLPQCGVAIGMPGSTPEPACKNAVDQALAACLTKDLKALLASIAATPIGAGGTTQNAQNATAAGAAANIWLPGGGQSPGGKPTQCAAEVEPAIKQYASDHSAKKAFQKPVGASVGGATGASASAAGGSNVPAAIGGNTPPPGGGATAAILPPELTRYQCRAQPGAPGVILCRDRPGLDACEGLKKAGRVAACRQG